MALSRFFGLDGIYRGGGYYFARAPFKLVLRDPRTVYTETITRPYYFTLFDTIRKV